MNRSFRVIRRYGVMFMVLGVVLLAARMTRSDEPSVSTVPQVPDTSGSREQWIEVGNDEKADILDMLADRIEANYTKIRTVDAVFDSTIEQRLSSAQVSRMSVGGMPPGSAGGIPSSLPGAERQKHFATTRVVMDMSSGDGFWSKQKADLKYFAEATGKEIAKPYTKADEGNWIVSAQQTLQFDPQMRHPGYRGLSHPEAGNARAVFRFEPKFGRSMSHADLFDPRGFFSASLASEQQAWQDLRLTARSLRGEEGGENEELAQRLTRVYQSVKPEGTDYRLERHFFSGPSRQGRPSKKMTVDFRASAGLNPTQTIWTSVGSNALLSDIKWDWKNFDGILFPESIHLVSYMPDGTIFNAEHDFQLVTCKLNEPIAPKQFEYTALGAEPGDLFLDKVNYTASIIRYGYLEEIGPYGNRPPSAWEKLFARGKKLFANRLARLIAGTAVVLVLFIAVMFWRWRLNRRLRGLTDRVARP